MENSEKSTSRSDKNKSNPFTRALKVFLRLLVSIMVGLSIGLGLYFGGVTLYRIAVGPGPSYDQQLQDYQIYYEPSQFQSNNQSRHSRANFLNSPNYQKPLIIGFV